MNTTYELIRRTFSGQETSFGTFETQDDAAKFYQENIKINPRFDSFFVIDKIHGGRTVRALIFGALKKLEK